MTALEAFNALDNREVSRKEVEQVLTQAKAENNTAIIYRLSRVLNDSPEATHFEITITHYDSSVGLSGVQHTGDYREALDDCGRLRKGWKFVKGNVVKVEEKPKKEAKPKKEKAPQKDTKKDKKYKFVVITDDRHSRVIAVFSYTNPNIEELSEHFWKNSEGKYYETTEEGLRNYTFGIGFYPFEKAKKHIEKKYTEGKDFIYFRSEKDGGRDKAISLVEKPKKEAKAKKEKAPKKENVEDSSKKKVEKAPAKATKSLKSRKEKGENVANFSLLQEPTKVFLEFEDEKNQAYYKKSANKQGAVGADFLKKVIKDLKKQNLREEPRGFINTEDFPVSPTISKVTGIDSLKTVVVKDKNRPTLECVLIEADRYVATDLYNIILLNRSKNDGLKTGALYDPNYKCTKIGGCSKEDYYRILDYGFPNYKPILTENPVYTSDWVAIEPIIQHLKSGLEVIRKIYDWKRVYVVKITSNVGEGHYNLKYLLNDLQILQSNGAKKIRLYTNKLDEKLNIETDNGNIVVTMAVYIGDRSNYDVISPLRIAPVQLHFTQNRKEEKGLSGVDYSQGLFGDIGLNAPRHEGILKEALNECGRLKKGWKFEKGKAVKVETKKGKDKEGEQKELDLYMQEMKMAIKESKAGKFDKKNILSWLSKFPDKVKGLLYNFLYHHYLLDQEEAKLRKSKKLVPFGLISVQAGISEFVSKLMDLEREDFFDLYFFFRDNMDECIELLEDKEVKKNYYEKKKKGLSGVDYSQGLFGVVGLNAPRHEGALKEALNECGRLKKGWKFEKGKAVKVDTKTKKEKGTKESNKKIKIIPPYVGDIEYNEEGDNYIALEKELGDIMGAKFDQWQKEIIAHNREKKLEMYSKEIWKKIDAEKDTKEDVYVGDYEPDEKGFYYEIRQIGKKKYRLELSVHRYGRFSVYPTAIEDFKSLKECGDFLIKTLDKSNGFYYTNMLGLSQLQNKINELKGYQYSKQIHFEDEDEGLTGVVPEVSTERFKKMSVPELREYTLEYYLENYGGKSISKNFFKEDNIQIEFFNTAGKKLQKPIYKEKVAVLEHLESLIKNSTYNNWGNRKESSPPNIIGYLNFKAKVTIDGEKRHVRISIAVDRDRKFRFKTLEVGANPKKKKQATSIPAPWVTERLRDSSLSESIPTSKATIVNPQGGEVEPLSEGKGTKKSLSRKKKDENFGLNASKAPVTTLPAPRQTLAQQLATRPEVRESFLVADEQMSLFLGALEKKTKDSLVITLTGKQGSGKTRFAFQFMNALAQRYRVGHASIEEHPESVLYEEKAYQYLNDTALEHITAQDVRSLAELDTMIHTNEVIVIDSFQKMRELAPKFEVDKDLRKKYDGKLFLVIFQQTADGKMRGGSKSQFDGDIILFTETFPDYRENYVYPDKNRYNKLPATELQYSIYEQRMLATAPEVPALPAHYEPAESEELNFEVL